MSDSPEINSIKRVLKELDPLFEIIQKNLEKYSEDNSLTEKLKDSARVLDKVHGTLMMIEQYGAALVIDEVSELNKGLIEGSLNNPVEALEILLQSILQLPEFLIRLRSGNQAVPIILLPLINDIRAVRNKNLLSENVLFFPDVTQLKSNDDGEYSKDLGRVAHKLRLPFLKALLQWYKGKDVIKNLSEIDKVLKTLQEHAVNPASKRLWSFAEGIIISLIDRSLESNISVKLLIAHLERLFKPLIEKGEKELVSLISPNLQKNMLFYLARSPSKDEHVQQIRETYHLANLLPQDDISSTAQETLAGPNLELLQVVNIGVKEDISYVKELIKAYTNGVAEDEDIANILSCLEKISDTLGMLGMEQNRQALAEQKKFFAQLIESKNKEVKEQDLMALASELLKIEDALDSYIVSYSDDFTPKEEVEKYTAEYKVLLSIVIKESLKNFEKAKVAILAYLGDIENQTLLANIPSDLKEVEGAMFIAPLDKVSPLISDLGTYVQQELITNKLNIDKQQQDNLADAFIGIEYYLEAVEENKGSKIYILGHAKEAVARLTTSKGSEKPTTSKVENDVEDVTVNKEPLPIEVADTDKQENIKAEALGADKEVSKDIGKEEIEAQEKLTTKYAIIGDDADEEILEIFIEECLEELDNINQALGDVRNNKDTEEAGIILRRSFHTLKGSGRLLGAELMGEFAWAHENLIHKVLENPALMDESVISMIEQAAAVLPQLIAQLGGEQEPVAGIEETIAHVLKAGEELDSKEQKVKPENEIVLEPVVEKREIALEIDEEPESEEIDEELEEIELSTDTNIELEIEPSPDLESGVDLAEKQENDKGLLAVQKDPILFEIFEKETLRHIATVNKLINEVKDDKLEASNELIKALHTLYGSAQSVDVPQIADLSGELEVIAKLKQENKQLYGKKDIKLLSESISSISRVLEELKKKYKLLDVTKLTTQLIQVSKELQEKTAKKESEQDLELLDIFIEEADEILDSLGEQHEAWQANYDDKKVVKAIQRGLHTLKGGARMAQFTPIADLSHALEHLIVLVSDDEVPKTEELFEVIQDSIDGLTVMLEEAKKRTKISEIRWLLEDIKHIIDFTPEEAFDKSSDENIKYLQDEVSLLEKQEKISNQQQVVEKNQKESLETLAEIVDEQSENFKSKDKQELKESSPASESKQVRENIRISAKKIDDLINFAGEVNIYHARLGQQINNYHFNLSELDQTISRLREQLRKMHSETEEQILYQVEQESQDDKFAGFDPLEMDRYSQIQQLSKSLLESVSDIESIKVILGDINKDSETLLGQQARVGTVLQDGLMEARMVKFSTLLGRLTRIVRQTASSTGKKAKLIIDGGDTEIDRSMQDKIIAPLEHMLRNAVAHGIETTSERKGKSKAAQGKVSIKLKREGADLLFTIEDDGKGLDLDAIKAKALQLKVISESQELNNNDIAQLIFHSGLSTASNVSQISGRGVGMDIVANDIKALGGSFTVATEKDKGTSISVRLPLTLAITQALIVNSGQDLYAIPIAGMVGVSLVSSSELKTVYEEKKNLSYGSEEFSLQYINHLINAKNPDLHEESKLYPVLYLRTAEHNIALQVDSLIGRREVVVKPIGTQISSVAGITGATIMPDGSVVFILDIAGLYRSYRGSEIVINISEYEGAEVETSKGLTVMVVDDSITIRKVTLKMLERYGINVITAKDGVEAVALLNEQKPDLMLLDIEMPRMDGFEVASYVKNTPDLNDLPIIMITSRTGDKHRQRAKELGVTRYLGKPYQENELLSNVADLLDSNELRSMIND